MLNNETIVVIANPKMKANYVLVLLLISNLALEHAKFTSCGLLESDYTFFNTFFNI